MLEAVDIQAIIDTNLLCKVPGVHVKENHCNVNKCTPVYMFEHVTTVLTVSSECKLSEYIT